MTYSEWHSIIMNISNTHKIKRDSQRQWWTEIAIHMPTSFMEEYLNDTLLIHSQIHGITNGVNPILKTIFEDEIAERILIGESK